MTTWLHSRKRAGEVSKDRLLSNLAAHGFLTAAANIATWQFDPVVLEHHLKVWDVFRVSGHFVDVHSGQVYEAPARLRTLPRLPG